MSREGRRWFALLVVAATGLLAVATPAVAYDTGPHAEITADAMGAEGFGPNAIGVAQVNNWFVDFYEQADKNPFSGHAGFVKRLAAGAVLTEGWSDELIAAAGRSHFDSSTATLFDTAGVTHEWDRLRRATWTLAREACLNTEREDPLQLLAVLGMSLHQVQDFYSHTNWIEPQSAGGAEVPAGADGPGWQALGYGSSPTWFDIPASERERASVYTANTRGPGDTPNRLRQHGNWDGSEGDFDGDKNRTLTITMNKDWPGRPLYLPSAIAAYFATRQWVQAVRSWVADEPCWTRAQRYSQHLRDLRHDLDGSFAISLYTGHWQGQGEPPLAGAPGPGGSLLSARAAIRSYFKWRFAPVLLRGRTIFRSRFEDLIVRMAEFNPPGQIAPVPSSQDLQRSLRIVVLRVLHMRGIHLGDPGPDDADLFAGARIDGQPFTSAVIHDHDRFSFPDPAEPFTWIKAVPAVPDEGEPVESIEVEVRTGDVRYAGTDDDVRLRLGANLVFGLDKRLYDDFERGDRDTYSVPIDEAVRSGLRVGDITRVQIEKSRDGIAGGWRLAGIRLRVNGRVVYDDPDVSRWLEDGHRTWTAPDFVPRAPRGPKVPVSLILGEDDLLYGGNDVGDINPFDRRRRVSVGYAPGQPLERETIGGGRLGGRLDDGGEGAVRYRLETVTPEPIRAVPPPPPPPPPPLQPDLVVTAFTLGSVTVANLGPGPAGPFRLRAGNALSSVVQSFSGLAAGASETRALTPPLTCTAAHIAIADDLEQVAETNEVNNVRDVEPAIC